MSKQFTGWHMTALLVGFFGIVIVVNVTMARFASSTFGGALAENGYVASQDYNRWIAQARKQDRLGWTVKASVAGGHLVLALDGVTDASTRVRLVHPLGRVAETTLLMRPDGSQRSVSEETLPPGRWQVHVILTKGGKEARFILDVNS